MNSSTPVRLVIADDHPIFRKGLRQIIAEDRRLQLVGEASNGAEVLQQVLDLHPAVAVIDLAMPGLDGIAVARKIQEQRSSVAVVLLTMHKGEDLFNAAVDAGVSGYVLKENAAVDLINCILAAVEGRSYFSPEFSDFLLRRHAGAQGLRTRTPGLKDLTPAECRILKLIADGLTSKEIADALQLSPRTVDNHRYRMSEKLGLQGAHSLVKFAFEHKSSL